MKSDYRVEEVSRKHCSMIFRDHHYLSGFRSGVHYGLLLGGEVCGAIVFSGFPVPELAVGLFGLGRNQQQGLFELSRLCLLPRTQKGEHNITSWFVAKAINKLRKKTEVKAILSYADSDYHSGIIYQATNFKYYGTSAKRKDFFKKELQLDIFNGEVLKKQSRGKSGDGVWVDRSLKHRYLLTFDKKLKPRWDEMPYPKGLKNG